MPLQASRAKGEAWTLIQRKRVEPLARTPRGRDGTGYLVGSNRPCGVRLSPPARFGWGVAVPGRL